MFKFWDGCKLNQWTRDHEILRDDRY
jgi:hypothetical protein